jgi:DNA polymerase-3 subunit alpha
VYQEQVMQIAQVIGGYTLGGADLLRRAMGKKKPEEMALQRDIFVSGAKERGLSHGKATQLFDLMEKFAATASTSRTPRPTRCSPTRPRT